MPDGTTKENFWRSVGRGAVTNLRWLMSWMPLWLYRPFRWVVASIGRLVMLSKQKIIMTNLEIAYGDSLSLKEKKRISSRCRKYFAYGMVDLIYIVDRPQMIKDNVTFEGLEHLETALKAEKGAIFFGGHYGNFILMYIALAAAGYKTNVIMKRVRDEQFEEYISQFRKERGINTIYDLPARNCVSQCIKSLRSNETLTILIDQNYGSAGRIFVDFFGRKAATAAGPVVFSNRTGAPVLPIFMEATGDLKYAIRILPPVSLLKAENSEDEERVMEGNVATLTGILEDQIRKSPHQWAGWMHKRWKSIPRDEQRELDRQLSEGRQPDTLHYGSNR